MDEKQNVFSSLLYIENQRVAPICKNLLDAQNFNGTISDALIQVGISGRKIVGNHS